MVLVLAGAALLSACGGTPEATQAPAADPARDAADKSFVDAVRNSDAGALGSLLDANFAWISANGKSINRAETLAALPKPALADETGADLTRSTYSAAVHSVIVNAGKLHSLRLWVKRPEGWRVLVYQEVQSADAFPAAAAGACENPCKSIPFTPQGDAQQGVAGAYMTQESATAALDPLLWASTAAYEFLTASSNATEMLTKLARVEQLQQKNMGGYAPVPLVSGTMEEFPGVVIMRSKHQPAQGNAVEATRVWILRDTKWVSTLSFQTAVQPASSQIPFRVRPQGQKPLFAMGLNVTPKAATP